MREDDEAMRREPQEDLLRSLVRNYTSEQVRTIEPVRVGLENLHYHARFATGRAAFIKAFDAHRAAAATREAQALRWLAGDAFTVPTVWSTRDGAFVMSRDSWCFLVMDFIAGTTPGSTPETLGMAGGLLARLHATRPPFALPGYEYSRVELSADLEATPDCDPPVRALVETALSPRVESVLRARPGAFAHCDLQLSNMIRDAEGRHWLIDLEHASWEPPIFDLARCIVFSCRAGAHMDSALCRAVVQGYESVRRLESEERSGLYAAFTYATAIAVFWRFREQRRLGMSAGFYRSLHDPCAELIDLGADAFEALVFGV